MIRLTMKWSFLLFSSFLCLQAIAQYPATGNKMRLGWQTTGDGLVYRGAIGDTTTLDPSGLNNAWMLLDTASGNLYAYRAKAWRLVSGGGGSVSDTLTGEVKGPLDSTYIDTVANIIFTTTTDTTVGVGELEYNDTQGSLIQGLKGGNVTNVIGQQIHQRVTNATGAPLTKGTAVFLYGSQGNRITVRKALATADSTSANTFGIVAESIADNQSGYVITEGLITNMNTNALTEGAAVYLSPTVAGELTTTKPQAPQHTVYIGVCVKQNAGSGELFVKIRNGQELDELHDVLITSPASNASLYYNAAQGVWRDTTGAVLTSDTSVFARDFQISGTANYLAKFTGSNAVGNSVAFNTGRNLYINSTQDNSASSLSNSFQFNGYGSNAFDQPSIGVFGNTGTNPNHRPYLAMYRSFGDTANSKTLVPYNSYLGSIVWHGADGVNLASRGAEIGAITDSITGVTDMPTALFFGTTTNGAASPTERMRITSPGNVGIATSSPSRPLHVAGTTAIRIPVGTTVQRPSDGANGDIRYNTTNANFEWHTGTAWREPVNAARSPAASLANRFSKFDANGLLDTSAVLVQVNGRIGINAATPQVALEINGRMRLSRGTNNTFIGIDAGNDTITGNRNIGIGNGTLSLIGSGTFNIGIGSQVLAANTTGSNNFGIGVQSLLKNTTGSSNVSFGVAAMFENTTGSGNLAIGTSALNKNTTASNNVGIGYAALYNNTIGENNVALGYQALFSSTTVSQNVAIGTGALQTTTGEKSTAIGAYALQSATTGTQNLAIGNNAAVLVAGGSNNTILGSGAAITTSSGGNNTQMDNAVIIGQDARPSSSANTNEIVIGYQGRGNGSNTTTIGNSSTTNTIIPAGSLTVDVMRRKAPVTVTGNHTLADGTSWLICNGTGTIILTLPAASSWTGREIMVKTVQPQAVTSASSNVVPIDGVATGTAILPATDGAWCTLVSDGTNWIIMQRGT